MVPRRQAMPGASSADAASASSCLACGLPAQRGTWVLQNATARQALSRAHCPVDRSHPRLREGEDRTWLLLLGTEHSRKTYRQLLDNEPL